MQKENSKQCNLPKEDATSLNPTEKPNDDSIVPLGTLFDVAGNAVLDEKHALLSSVQKGRLDLARELARYGFSWGKWWATVSDESLADRISDLDGFFRGNDAVPSGARVAALGELVQAYAICPQDLLFGAILHGDEAIVDLFKRRDEFSLGAFYEQALREPQKQEEKEDNKNAKVSEAYILLRQTLKDDTDEAIARKLSWLAEASGIHKLPIFKLAILTTEQVKSREVYEFCVARTDLKEHKTQFALAQHAAFGGYADMLDSILHETPSLSNPDLEYLIERTQGRKDTKADVTTVLLSAANERGILTPVSLALTSEEALKRDWDFETLPDGTCRIIGYKGREHSVIVPPSIGNQPVSGIGRSAFDSTVEGLPLLYKKRRAKITSIEFPGSLRTISDLTFGDTENAKRKPLRCVVLNEGIEAINYFGFSDVPVRQVSLPSSLRHIGPWAFSGSTFQQVDLHEGLESIDYAAFTFCDNIKEITLPQSLRSLGAMAFGWCDNLARVSIPERLTSIPDRAFVGCEKLPEISLPQSATSIEKRAFAFCHALQHIKFSDYLLEIDDYAFLYCTKLHDLLLPDTVERLGKYAFAKCHSLCEITLPGNLKDLGEGVFSECDSLTRIVIPEGVTTIPSAAFEGCWNLDEVVLPKSVTRIGQRAFADCQSLTNIVFGARPRTIEKDAFDGCHCLKRLTMPGDAKRRQNLSLS